MELTGQGHAHSARSRDHDHIIRFLATHHFRYLFLCIERCYLRRSGAAAKCVDVSEEDGKLLATAPTGELAALPVIDPTKMEPTTAYFVAKRANHVRVEAATVRYGAKGARLVSIRPALIATPRGQAEFTGRNREIAEQTIDGTSAKRIGTTSDIAALVEFLASPQASYINGTDIRIDSGLVATQRYAG